MSQKRQIFQTSSSTRWKRTKWAVRTFLFLLTLIISILGISIYFTDKDLPGIPLEGSAIKKVLTDTNHSYRESRLEKEYKGFRRIIDQKWKEGQKNPGTQVHSNLFTDSLGIRAAFYVNWDMPQSFNSLERNISKINLILPEWLFIDPNKDALYSSIDPKALAIMRKAGVKIMPMLSNNFGGIFRGDVVKRIILNPQKRAKLLDELTAILKENKFIGVNIDFEELQFDSDEPLVQFQKDLYERLHQQGMYVSQDVIPFNKDYNFKALSAYNDYLILMAYDQHSADTKPGPISSQKWIEAALEDITTKTPKGKIILALAAFGHNWILNDKKAPPASDVTYQQAMALASNSDAKVDFNNETYNLDFTYFDTENRLHQVYFVDAATNFNTLRYATEMKIAGTALWRMGSEDARIWDFYENPMTKSALKNYSFEKFDKIQAGVAPDFEGTGEILDIVAAPKDGLTTHELDPEDILISEEQYVKLPSTYVLRRFGQTDKRKIVLSFDDGPDPQYTKEILDTLAYYHTPASFFVVGYQVENNIPLLKRIYQEGHEIGNHTFFHPDMSKVSMQRAALEMDATRLLIECITGRTTILFRAPFNADSEPGKYEELKPILLSREKNYITVGESIDPNDWETDSKNENVSADTIFQRIVDIYDRKTHTGDPDDSTINGSIILLHDAGGNRENTVKATGMIIRYFKSKGYEFTTIADLLGKSKNDIMPRVAKGKEFHLLSFNYALAETGYFGSIVLFTLFLLFLILGAIRLLVLGIAAMKEKTKRRKLLAASRNHPIEKVSIIVPAYNEEVNIVHSLSNLLKCDYPLFEIIFVDDGSKDNTFQLVQSHFANEPRLSAFTKANGGKASALNFGIAISDAAFVICIDADTKLSPNAVSLLMRNFYVGKEAEQQKVAAVAGTVKVGNKVNMLTNWQSIEYITSQNFDRNGFAYFNAITVIPGAIGAFRKSVLQEIGGFSTDTLAEDCDLTISIIKKGYIVRNEPQAYAYTEAPETMKQFIKQRVRWSFGVMQTFWKHKELLFNTNVRSMGLIAFPDMLLFRYVIPFFMPFADLMMLIALLRGDYQKTGLYFLIFVVIDACIASIAFVFEKEKISKLLWLIPQRLIYRWIMIYVFFKALKRVLKGELQSWGTLKRSGNVVNV